MYYLKSLTVHITIKIYSRCRHGHLIKNIQLKIMFDEGERVLILGSGEKYNCPTLIVFDKCYWFFIDDIEFYVLLKFETHYRRYDSI